jgi:hypothetical protein
MLAILALCLTYLKAADHVLCSRDVFGATVGLSQNTLQKFSVEVSFIPFIDADKWREAAKPNTRMLFIENRPILIMPWQILLRWPRSVMTSAPYWPSTTASARLSCKRPCCWVLIS